MKFMPMCVFDSEKYTFDYSLFDTGLFEAEEYVTFVDTLSRTTWFQPESRQTTWSSLPKPTLRWQTLKKKGTAWERQ
jgi:hypothetical protein